MEPSFTALKHMRKRVDEVKREYDVEGLNEILEEYETLKDSELYKRIVELFFLSVEDVSEPGSELTDDEQENLLILNIAREVLGGPPLIYFLYKGMITPNDVMRMYDFIGAIYHYNIHRKLNKEDVKKIYFGKIDEKVISKLNKFDETSSTPKPTPQFFTKIKNTKWKNQKTKKLHKQLQKIRKDAIHYIFWSDFLKVSRFLNYESYFLLFLSACSAVNNNREEITMDDVIMAYKTYFKLLRADLPSLMEKLE